MSNALPPEDAEAILSVCRSAGYLLQASLAHRQPGRLDDVAHFSSMTSGTHDCDVRPGPSVVDVGQLIMEPDAYACSPHPLPHVPVGGLSKLPARCTMGEEAKPCAVQD